MLAFAGWFRAPLRGLGLWVGTLSQGSRPPAADFTLGYFRWVPAGPSSFVPSGPSSFVPTGPGRFVIGASDGKSPRGYN